MFYWLQITIIIENNMGRYEMALLDRDGLFETVIVII